MRKILQLGDPKLKNKNTVVKDSRSLTFKRLLKDLKDTMYKTGLIGIAAPQIGRNVQVFLTHPRPTQYRKKGVIDELRTYINPRITYFSKEKSVIYEGCGCVGTTADVSIFGPVERPKEVEVEATDEKGKRFSLRCDGVLARVIQHEMDHLNGIEFIEKVSDYRKLLSREFYIKKIKNTKATKKILKITLKQLSVLASP